MWGFGVVEFLKNWGIIFMLDNFVFESVYFSDF